MAEIPGVRSGLVERGALIPRERILQVLALLGIDHPDTVAALSIDQVTAEPGQWRGQVTVIRRSTYRQRIAGPGLNGPARFVEHHTERRQHIPIIEEP